MVKSTRKGKMSKKRAGTRKIKGGAGTVQYRPQKSWFSNAIDSVQSRVDDVVHAAAPHGNLINANIHNLTYKKAHRGGSKTQKGGMDLSGLLDGAQITIDNLNVEKKRHAGGMSCGTKKHDKKSKKGGKKHGGMAVPMPGGGKKSKKHGGMAMPGGGKKSKKGGGPKEGTRAWAQSLPKSMRAAYEPGFNPWTGGKKSKKGGRSKYYNSLPHPSGLQSHFPAPGGWSSYYPSK